MIEERLSLENYKILVGDGRVGEGYMLKGIKGCGREK